MNTYKSAFPIFRKYPDLVYLDSAATTQRPEVVVDAISHFYKYENANIHRGVYDLSNKASNKFEEVRQKTADFVGSGDANTIGFTSGVTESMNIIATTFVKPRLNSGDNVVTTIMEHHANFIPWQMLCKETSSEFRVSRMSDKGDLDLDHLETLLDENTRILAVNHISNTLGTINDIARIIRMAHKKNIPVVIDAAQSAAFYDIDFSRLDYDFLTFSGHKLFGPFGIGVLFARTEFGKEIGPFNYGGGIISEVGVEETKFRSFPHNLDAGTPNIAGVIGLGAAIDFVNSYDKKEVEEKLQALTVYATEQLGSIQGCKILGEPAHRSGILSLILNDIHPHDVASFLNKDDIAVRAGMHCTQPLIDRMQVVGTTRASFSLYNDRNDVDRLVKSVRDLIKLWE